MDRVRAYNIHTPNYFKIHCYRCDFVDEAADIDILEFVDDLNGYGWVIDDGEKPLCPKCAKRQKTMATDC